MAIGKSGSRRRVVFMNLAAGAFNAQADGIRVSPEGIRLAIRSEDERLQGLIAGVTTAQRSRRSVGEVMRASRPSNEIIEEDLTLPPHPQRVWRIVRTVRFPPDQQPLVKNLLSDLCRKYGPESFANAGAIPNLHW